MNRSSTLVMSGADHRRLRSHLFPGDGKEAAAVLACTRVDGRRLKLLVREMAFVPYDDCTRTPVHITWPAEFLDTWQDRSEAEGFSLILVHSHPTGLFDFSPVDDDADREVMPYLYPYGRAGGAPWHGSAIMMPSGAIRARLYDRATNPHPIDLVAVYGDDLRFFWSEAKFELPRPMAFSEEMVSELGRLSAAVIGVSGTGSIVAEQLLRMGFGEIVVVDHDIVEGKNLNRILNTTVEDVEKERSKVEVFKQSAARSHPKAHVLACPKNLRSVEAIELAAHADMVFSCVDTFGGRHLADRLASATLQPLFDVGVVIPVRHPPRGMVISNICGRIDYIQPGGSSLLDREVYTPALLAAENLLETDPIAHAKQVAEGYMPGTQQQAPSVITVNMRAASSTVQEFVARAYPYRSQPNRNFARSEFDLVDEESTTAPEDQFTATQSMPFAQGLASPLLGLPDLEDLRCAC